MLPSTQPVPPASPKPKIGSRLFVGGATRDVYLDDDGRQFVLDDDGNPVHGVWIYIPEPDIQSK